MQKNHKYLEWHQNRVKIKQQYFDELAKELVERFNPSRVLDVGCADGLLLYSFSKFGVKGHGIDISKARLTYAHKNIKSNLILLDIEKGYLPFKPNSFDLITISEVLEHLNDLKWVISEMSRVLKQNGIILMSSPSKVIDSLNPLLGKVSRLCNSKKLTYETPTERPYHVNVHSSSFWIKIFESQGFRLMETSKIYYLERLAGFRIRNSLRKIVTPILPSNHLLFRKVRHIGGGHEIK